MIENDIIASQFGCPGKPLVPVNTGDRFGMPNAVAADQPSDVLNREAALLLAETGLRFSDVARRLGQDLAETAEMLAPCPWRYRLPEEEDESGMVWRGGGGFRQLSVTELGVLSRDLDDKGRLRVRRLRAGSRKFDAIEKLIRAGFLYRDGKEVCITAHGEALLYREQTRRV